MSSTTTAPGSSVEKLVSTTVSSLQDSVKTLATATTTAAAKIVPIATTTTKAASVATSPSPSPSPSPSSFTTSSVTVSTAFSAHNGHHGDEKMLNVADLSSSLQHFGVVDYFIFLLMLVVCAAIGFYFGFIEKKKKKNRNLEQRRGSEALDYLVGGRKMKVFPVSLSLVASFVSGISLLGTSTEIYVYGTQYAFILVTLAISGVISWYIFLPVFCDLQLTSTYEYFEMRFGKSVRYFCSILFIVGVVLYLPVAIYVPALTFSQVSGMGVYTITPIVCIVCTFYTCVGGLKAVIWTDAVQSFVMYGTVLTICIKGTLDLGGLSVVLDRNWAGGRLLYPELTWDPTVRLSLSAILVGSVLHKVQSNDVNQMSIQRFMSLPDTNKVKQCLILFTVLLMFLLFGCCYMGLLTYATYHDCDPLSTKLAKADDQLPTILIMHILGSIPGLPGLFVAGVFSAALSSLSTALNSMACVISEDLVKPFINLTEKQNFFLLRAIVTFFGLTCIPLVFLVEKMGTVLQLATMTGAVTMGPILGFYSAGVLMPWIKEKSCFVGGVVSFMTMGWICINAQLGQMSGVIRHPKLPVSVEGCTYGYDNTTYWERHNYTPSERNIYHLSFMWYTGVGGIVCCVVANLATLVFGCTKADDINPELISPVIRKYLPRAAERIVMTDIQELPEKEPLHKFAVENDTIVRKQSLDEVE